MSYRGRPSKGCESCRSRKVKCDEGKPRCGRCTKSHNECKYRDQADLLFRNQTAFAAQKAEESWRKRAKSHTRASSSDASRPSPPSIGSQQSPPSERLSPESNHHESPVNEQSSLVLPHASSFTASEFHNLNAASYDVFGTGDVDALSIGFLDSLSLGYELQPDPAQRAYDRFVYDFVVPESPDKEPGAPSDSLWDFIPALYQYAREDSCLATIVRSVSFANYANRYRDSHARQSADEAFGKAIKLLQKAIQSKKDAATDATLAAVYLMGVYENLTSSAYSGGYLAHKEGANALIKLRTMEEFYSNPISARLYESSYAQMIIGNLQMAMPPTLPIKNLVAARQFLPQLYSTSGIYVIQIISEEAELHSEWHKMRQSAISSPPTSRSDLQAFLSKALTLVAKFQAWEDSLPPSWQYQVQPNTREVRSRYDARWVNLILGGAGAPAEIHAYSSLKKAWIWMFYRTSRIFLLRDLLEVLNWMLKLPESSPSTSPNHAFMDASHGASSFASSEALDTTWLQRQHSNATNQLITVVERSAAAILGHFTVPIHTKSAQDVCGIRGYTSFWSLGVLDAVLKSGLVPDSGPVRPTPPPTHEPYQDPSVWTTCPDLSASYLKHGPGTAHPAYHDLGTAQHIPSTFQTLPTTSLPAPIPALPQTSQAHIQPLPEFPILSKNHPFDSSAPHPFDVSTHLGLANPLLPTSPSPQTPLIDVNARRQWLHGIIFYLGSELGIKKGLAILALEGSLDRFHPAVDSGGTLRG
ncbi:hypothetical protein P154DRAFT_477036 [Amniculicola lignicola CBS 123094]|uniref:Zn(2)-C6 fungal-type domain-containing protein n=1 Tax=Amniculicola lignicola CBS 123094 TaxID=1392246 RepID=A0A6A5VWG9_9PLEO|nr:hypothetical protein P154DRAFT_477036 [Amniculicola lignicola CBS 123094]